MVLLFLLQESCCVLLLAHPLLLPFLPVSLGSSTIPSSYTALHPCNLAAQLFCSPLLCSFSSSSQTTLLLLLFSFLPSWSADPPGLLVLLVNFWLQLLECRRSGMQLSHSHSRILSCDMLDNAWPLLRVKNKNSLPNCSSTRDLSFPNFLTWFCLDFSTMQSQGCTKPYQLKVVSNCDGYVVRHTHSGYSTSTAGGRDGRRPFMQLHTNVSNHTPPLQRLVEPFAVNTFGSTEDLPRGGFLHAEVHRYTQLNFMVLQSRTSNFQCKLQSCAVWFKFYKMGRELAVWVFMASQDSDTSFKIRFKQKRNE